MTTKTVRLLAVASLAVGIPATVLQAADHTAPAGKRYANITARGTILPGGRILQPMGALIETGPGPFGLAVGPKGMVATANIGFERIGVTVLSPSKSPNDPKGPWDVRQLWTRTPGMKAPEEADPEWKGVFYGIAFEGEKSVWVSEGDSGQVRLMDTTTSAKRKLVNLNEGEWKHSFSADLAFDAARHRLYVVDQANFRVAVIDTAKGKVMSSVKVGRMPYAITHSHPMAARPTSPTPASSNTRCCRVPTARIPSVPASRSPPSGSRRPKAATACAGIPRVVQSKYPALATRT